MLREGLPPPLVSYRVAVVTSDVAGAGADVAVSLRLRGEKDDTGFRSLDMPECVFLPEMNGNGPVS